MATHSQEVFQPLEVAVLSTISWAVALAVVRPPVELSAPAPPPGCVRLSLRLHTYTHTHTHTHMESGSF